MAALFRSRGSSLTILLSGAFVVAALLSWTPARSASSEPPQTGPVEPPSTEVVRSAPATPAEIEEAFAAFWAAENPEAAAARIGGILATGVTFEDALARLHKGR